MAISRKSWCAGFPQMTSVSKSSDSPASFDTTNPPGAVELFTKDSALPKEMQSIPYDINSVMHFGEREYTKNGHRTIMFKDRKQQQLRVGLTALDLRKIEMVYGPECLKRDRQEKIEMCQAYPGVARRKREVDQMEVRNLRANREITAPPDNNTINTDDTNKTVIAEIEDDVEVDGSEGFDEIFKELGIADEVQNIVEQVHKTSSQALKNARSKYCNITKTDLRTDVKGNTDLLGIVKLIADYAKSVVDNAISNLTVFCLESTSVESYQRQRCNLNFGSDRCRPSYRSTKSGAVKYSTQHRPLIRQSTRRPPHRNREYALRAVDDNVSNFTDLEVVAIKQNRKKRNVETAEHNVSTIIVNNTQVTKDAVEKEEATQKTIGPGYRRMNRKSVEYLKQRLRARPKEEEFDQDFSEGPKSGEKSDGGTQREYSKPDRPTQEKRKRIKKGPQIEPDRTLHQFKEDIKEDRIENWGNRNKKRKVEKTRDRNKMDDRHRMKEDVNDNKNDRHLEIEMDRDRRGREGKRHKGEGKKRDDSRVEMGRDETDSLPVNTPKPFKNQVKLRLNRIRKTTPASRPGVPKTVPLNKLNKEFYDERKWPTMVVPYILPESERFDLDDVRKRFEEVNRILRRRTCVSIKEITEDSAQQYEDYLVLDMSPDYVTGRVGGRQNFGSIELLEGGQHRQHTAMMVMAMLGFYFEVSRHDRDSYIRVHMRHIRPDKLHHFEKIREEATLDVPYDYYSATHPAWQFWRKIGKTGISTVATLKQHDPDGSIMRSLGQNHKLLSDIDILKINSVYGVDCFLPKGSAELDTQQNKPSFEEGHTQGFV